MIVQRQGWSKMQKSKMWWRLFDRFRFKLFFLFSSLLVSNLSRVRRPDKNKNKNHCWFLFLSLLCILNRLAHIWTSIYFQLQGWTVCMNPVARFKSILTVTYFYLQSWTVVMNRAARFISFWTLPYFQLNGITLPCIFEPSSKENKNF